MKLNLKIRFWNLFDYQLTHSDNNIIENSSVCLSCQFMMEVIQRVLSHQEKIQFILSPIIDIDECALKTANCGPDEICKNKPGGYTCSCPAGHTLNAQRRCEDVNECDFYHGQVKLRSKTSSIVKSICFQLNNCFIDCHRFAQVIPNV